MISPEVIRTTTVPAAYRPAYPFYRAGTGGNVPEQRRAYSAGPTAPDLRRRTYSDGARLVNVVQDGLGWSVTVRSPKCCSRFEVG